MGRAVGQRICVMSMCTHRAAPVRFEMMVLRGTPVPAGFHSRTSPCLNAIKAYPTHITRLSEEIRDSCKNSISGRTYLIPMRWHTACPAAVAVGNRSPNSPATPHPSVPTIRTRSGVMDGNESFWDFCTRLNHQSMSWPALANDSDILVTRSRKDAFSSITRF